MLVVRQYVRPLSVKAFACRRDISVLGGAIVIDKDIHHVGIAGKDFKVRGHRGYSEIKMQFFCSGGLHFDGAASRLTCFQFILPARGTLIIILFYFIIISFTHARSLSSLYHPSLSQSSTPNSKLIGSVSPSRHSLLQFANATRQIAGSPSATVLRISSAHIRFLIYSSFFSS